MKILYICSADLSGETGSLGSVRHIMEVSENLCRLGHQVRLIAPGYHRYAHPTVVRIHYVPIIRRRFLRTICHELFSPLVMLIQLVRWKPDVIYWRQAYLTVIPVLIGRIFGKRVVTEVNGLTLDEVESESISTLRKRTVLIFERINYRFSSHLTCVAPGIRDRIQTHYGLSAKKLSVIQNGVNADRIPLMETGEAKRCIGLTQSEKVVGFVGHFFPWDGLEFLIKAAPEIISAVPDVRFLIIGHGRWGEHLPELARRQGVEAHFTFTGKVPWEGLYLYLNAFDVAVAPYADAINAESGRSSLKILEYFACRKPVIASRTTVIPEIEAIGQHGYGLLVPPEDSSALADAIVRLLCNDDLRTSMCVGARAYVLEERSWYRVAQKTEKILEAQMETS